MSDMVLVWTKEQYDAILEDMRKAVHTLDAGIQAIVSMRNKGMLKIVETPLPAPPISERSAGE